MSTPIDAVNAWDDPDNGHIIIALRPEGEDSHQIYRLVHTDADVLLGMLYLIRKKRD